MIDLSLCPFIREANFAIRSPWVFPDRRLLDYLLVVVERGICRFVVEDRPYLLGPGQIFLVQPGDRVSLEGITDTVTPYVHFDIVEQPGREERFSPGPGFLDLKPYRHLVQPRLDDLIGTSVPTIIDIAEPAVFRDQLVTAIGLWQTGTALNRMEAHGLLALLSIKILRAHLTDEPIKPQIPSVLQHLEGFLRHRMHEQINLQMMAEQVGFSIPHMIRLCRQYWQQSPHQRLMQLRLEHAQLLLQNIDLSIRQIAQYCGFADTQHFVHVFRRTFDMTPTQARQAAVSGPCRRGMLATVPTECDAPIASLPTYSVAPDGRCGGPALVPLRRLVPGTRWKHCRTRFCWRNNTMAFGKSLSIPPLGGLASYQESARIGLSVEQNVRLLKRYAFVERRLMEIAVSHLCAVPEWEVKCALSLHSWLDAEHATVLRERVAEMREPPLHLDAVPDEKLEALLLEVLGAQDTVELLVGVYRVIHPALIEAYTRHLAETNPLADHPTCRQLRMLVHEGREMIAWGEAALVALTTDAVVAQHANDWEKHLRAYMHAAGGIWGDETAEQHTLPAPRAAAPFVLDLIPQRDQRFSDIYNFGSAVDAIAFDSSRSPHERTVALIFKRLREMDVPEWMATIIAQTRDKPWQYYVEMTRQLWDEARHAMMGEVGFESIGVDWTALPIPISASYAINTRLAPIERHAVLYSIEQGLMRRENGKRYEWETATAAGNPLLANFQDYDWADEVLHTQIGRRWLVTELGNRDALTRCVADATEKINEAYSSEPQLRQDTKTNWWPDFYASVRLPS